MDLMLDAGHDIFTAGKGVPSMKEFEFNRAVVLKIQQLLKDYEGVNALLSHDLYDGIDTSLKARTDLANKLKVKAFISVHADAFSNSSAKGETVFIYLRTGNSTLALANAINEELKADMSISNRGVKRADFHVLRETAMDAVLIEFGFMTNPEDLALLKSDAYRTKCAEMVVRALEKHYGLKRKSVVVTQPHQTTPNSAKRHVKIVNVNSEAIMMDKPDRISATNIDTIPKGTVVDMIVLVAGYNNGNTGYYKIVYNGKTGYINAKFGQEV